MSLTENILAEARSWIGTPYRHQGSAKGLGTDCLGLLRGVWRETFGAEPEVVPPYTEDWAEPERREVLWEAAERCLLRKPLAEAEPGDVVLFRMRETSIAKHLGIQSVVHPAPCFIHACTAHGVIERPVSGPWQRRIVARFACPKGAK